MLPMHRLIELPVRSDERGSLGFAQYPQHIPFPPKRVFYLYGLPSGSSRGGHAHRRLEQFILMLAGGCEVLVDNGVERGRVNLSTPSVGLYVPPMLWLELRGFAPNAVCVVLASDVYDEADYIRDRAEFGRLVPSGITTR